MKIMRIISSLIVAIVTMLFFVSCSTVEKRVYFSPSADQESLRGPAKPSCGWANFGGLPDTYIFKVDDKEISIQADENIHPYLWGPWFASVIPVFPITWAVEIFASNELMIRMHGDKQALANLSEKNVSISCYSTNERIRPESINKSGDNTTIIFPLDSRSVEEFYFHAIGLGKEKHEINVPFIRTYRWSWTQWTPNC